MKLTEAQRNDILTALIATAAPFDPAATFLGIAEAVVDKGILTTLADLTLPSATNYPRQAVTTWSAPFTLADGRRAVDSPLRYFVGMVDPDDTSAAAWYLADALTAGNLLAYQPIVPPKVLASPDHALPIVVRLTVDALGKWDASVVLAS